MADVTMPPKRYRDPDPAIAVLADTARAKITEIAKLEDEILQLLGRVESLKGQRHKLRMEQLNIQDAIERLRQQ